MRAGTPFLRFLASKLNGFFTGFSLAETYERCYLNPAQSVIYERRFVPFPSLDGSVVMDIEVQPNSSNQGLLGFNPWRCD